MKCHKIFLIILFCIMLIGCGKVQEKNAINEAQNVPANSDVRDKNVSSEDYSDVEETEAGAMNSDFGNHQEAEQSEEEVSEGNGELIIMRVQMREDTTDEYTEYGDIRIEALSLETGQCREIAVFPNNFRQFDGSAAPNPVVMSFPEMVIRCRNGNYRDAFSEDYTKVMMTTPGLAAQYEYCTGWVDTNGELTNISEKFRERFPYDYGHGLHHTPMGFEGDYFYFEACEYKSDSSSSDVYYRIRVDDMTGESLERLQTDIYKEIYAQELGGRSGVSGLYMTDWLDETHILCDELETHLDALAVEPYENPYETHIVIFDTQKDETSSLIPNEYGMCRNGVVSPNGKEIAFLMEPTTSQFDETGIYIKNLKSDEITSVKTDLSEQFPNCFLRFTGEGNFWSMNYPEISLLEWR